MKRVWNNPRVGDEKDWYTDLFVNLQYKGKKIKIKKITVEFERE